MAGTTQGATRESSEPPGVGRPVWFRWVADADGIAVVRSCSSHHGVWAFAGSARGALSARGKADLNGSSPDCDRRMLRFAAVAGEEYRFAVAALCASCPQTYTIALDLVPPAANDDLAGAEQLSGVPVEADGDTLASTLRSGEPGADPLARDSVWYRWTAPVTRVYAAQTCSDAPEHADSTSTIAISTGGGTLGSQRAFAVPGRPSAKCPAQHALVRFLAQGGRTYFLAVRTVIENPGIAPVVRPGPFNLRITASTVPPPPGDAFEEPIVVDDDDVTQTGSTVDATRQAFEPNLDLSKPTVWVDWRIPRAGQAVAQTCGSAGLGAELAFYDGDLIDGLTRLAAADGLGFDRSCSPARGTILRRPVRRGDRIRLSYADNPLDSGDYRLRLRVGNPPTLDLFQRFRYLTGPAPAPMTGSTEFARRESGEPVHAEHGEGSIWFGWGPPVTGRARLSTCGAPAPFRHVARVYHGLRVDTLRPVPTLEIGCTSWFDAQRGSQFYRIALEGRDRWNGPVQATLRLHVPSDFNGDGYADLAVGAPGEDDGAAADAGAVDVRYGGPAGLGNQGALLRLTPGSRDRFGAALAWGDLNTDDYADLVVGAPGRRTDIGAPAGAVAIFYGSAAGLPRAPDALVRHVAPAAGDDFGAAVGVGSFVHGFTGVDALAVGAPGDDDLGGADAGSVTVFDRAIRTITQDSPGIPDASEPGDRFGAALASGDLQRTTPLAALAVGAPGEDRGAGAAHVLYAGRGFGALGTYGSRLLRLGGSLPGAPSGGDGFGSALAIGWLGGADGGDLVVGAPGDAGPGGVRGGSVMVVQAGPNGVISEGARLLTQATTGETREAGDGFGASVAAGGLGLAVGAPGEDLDGQIDAGIVHVVPSVFFPGAVTRLVAKGAGGLPGAPAAHDAFGASVLTSLLSGGYDEALAVGAPGETVGSLGPAGGVYVVYGHDGPAPQRWTQGAGAVPGTPETGDAFGRLR